MSRPLEPRRVELWCAFLDDIDTAGRWSDYAPLCDASERERAARLRLPSARRRNLATRALVRTVLSRYVPRAPQTWHFDVGAHGRPRIADPGAVRLEFNIAHSEALVVMAVTAARSVGVDTEHIRRRTDTLALERYFAPAERARLAALPSESRRTRFFELWTLKEAYLKARGMGLRLPLRGVAFDLSVPDRVQLSFTGAFEDTARRWAFAQFTLREHYMLAVCAERDGEAALELAVHETVPLGCTRAMRPAIARAVGFKLA